MADNYLERRHDDYEERKRQWLLKKKHMPMIRRTERPEDENL